MEIDRDHYKDKEFGLRFRNLSVRVKPPAKWQRNPTFGASSKCWYKGELGTRWCFVGSCATLLPLLSIGVVEPGQLICLGNFPTNFDQPVG